MNAIEAERVIESLRHGIPPEGHVADFTVGRQEEILELADILDDNSSNAILLKANPGSGKTHLLKLCREMALGVNYAVSLITLDSQSGVGFDGMDQVFGQICRQMELPGSSEKGVGPLLAAVHKSCSSTSLPENLQSSVSRLNNSGHWDICWSLGSPAVFVALRAWGAGDQRLRERIEDWLCNPWQYKARSKELYQCCVHDLRRSFRDPRPERKFYEDDVFSFSTQGFRQCWDGLNDLDTLSHIAGHRGMILLVDEFEDVIHNMRYKKRQQAAFWNLFQFFSQRRFGSLSLFAVTPDFVHNCKDVLLRKEIWDYDDYSWFDQMRAFRMSPLEEGHLLEFSRRIVPVHFLAYGWAANQPVVERRLSEVCKYGMRIPVQDRVRQTIIKMVGQMDAMMQDNNGQ